MRIELIVLTKSDKLNNYCVAGIKTDGGEWIRLENESVSGHGLSLADITYSDGSVLKELDVVAVECEKAPNTIALPGFEPYGDSDDAIDLEISYQPENYYIDASIGLQKIRTATWEEVLRLHPTETKNYILACTNDRMTLDKANNLHVPRSLQFVQVSNLRIGTSTEKKHPKAEFDYMNRDGNALHYCLTVTDPDYVGQGVELNYDSAKLILSLGLPFAGTSGDDLYCFLLIAKVIVDE